MLINLFFLYFFSKSLKQPDISVYFKGKKVYDFCIVYNNGEVFGFSELFEFDTKFIKVTIVCSNHQKFEFEKVPRLTYINSEFVRFDLRYSKNSCTQIIKSSGTVSNIMGISRDNNTNHCKKWNILTLYND